MLKKVLSLLLSVCLLLGVTLSPMAGDVEVDVGDIGKVNFGGDVNGDRAVDLKDVLLLFRYCVDGEAEGLSYRAADCNGDTYIDLTDASYLAQNLAGWEDRTLVYNDTTFAAVAETGTNAGYVLAGAEGYTATPYAGNDFLGWYDTEGNLRYTAEAVTQNQLLCNAVAKFKDNNLLTSIGGGYESGSLPVTYQESSTGSLPKDTPYFYARSVYGKSFSEVAYSGSKSFMMNTRWANAYIYVPNLKQNTEYAVSFKVKFDTETAEFRGMYATDTDKTTFVAAKANSLGGYSTAISGITEWREVSFHFNTGDKTAVNLAYIYTAADEKGDAYNNMHFDELTMYELKDQASYVQYDVIASAENGKAYTNLLFTETKAYAGSRIVFTSSATNHDAQFLGWYDQNGTLVSSERVLTVESLSSNLNYTAKYTKGTTPVDVGTAAEITKALQQDGWYEPMFEKAIYNTGNQALIAKMVQKAKRGEELTVVGFGGSITQGAGTSWTEHSGRYINQICTYLEKALKVKVNVVNAGIGATSSLLGKGRIQEQVLSYNPDLVIVDFTTNDGADDERNYYSYESVIRTLMENEVATVALMFGPVKSSEYNKGTCIRSTNAVNVHSATLQYYNVPVINYFDTMWDYLDSNGDGVSDEKDLAQWKVLWHDYIHPSTAGHALSAAAVSYYLQKVIDNVDNIDTAVPAVPTEFLREKTASYYGIQMLTYNNVGGKQTGAEKVKTGLYGNVDANTITNWNPWLIEEGGYAEFTFNSLKSLTLMHVTGGITVNNVDGVEGNTLKIDKDSNVRVLVNGKTVLADSTSGSGAVLNWPSSTYLCNETGPVTVRIEGLKGTFCMTCMLVSE